MTTTPNSKNHEQGAKIQDQSVFVPDSLLLNPKRMKHIESILPEQAAGEISRMLAGDDATATAALTTLLHNVTGCDIPQTSDLPQSEVEELVPLCVSILRRHWQTPLTCLGDGSTPMSLADLMRQSIGDRVQGNEAWSIPAANANLPTAIAALTKRHIDDGLTLTLTDGTTTSLPDGLSLAQLLCSGLADNVTEIVDSNTGWTMNKALSNVFPNLADVELGCGLITSQIANNLPSIKSITSHATEIKYSPSNNTAMIDNLAGLEELHFPELKTANFGSLGYLYRACPNVLSITFPELETISVCNESCLRSTTLKEFIAPNLSDIKRYNIAIFLDNCTELEKVVVRHANIDRQYPGQGDLNNCPNLIHLEFAEGMDKKIYIPYWIPTNVLSDSERLPEFLSNFKTYIAERLTDKGSGLTLTLSQAVRDAIQTDPEIVSIITSKGWTISPAPSV